MKFVIAIVRPNRADEVRQALSAVGVKGLLVGLGPQFLVEERVAQGPCDHGDVQVDDIVADQARQWRRVGSSGGVVGPIREATH